MQPLYCIHQLRYSRVQENYSFYRKNSMNKTKDAILKIIIAMSFITFDLIILIKSSKSIIQPMISHNMFGFS